MDAVQRGLEYLDAFLAWWIEELVGLFPPSWRKRFRPAPPRNVVRIAKDGLGIGRIRFGGFSQRAEAPSASPDEGIPRLPRAFRRRLRRGSRVRIQVAAPLVLRRPVELPLAAEASLHQALSLQVDRYVPLKPELAYVDHRVLARNPEAGRLQVEIASVHRDRVDPVLAMLRSAGHEITAVEAEMPHAPEEEGFNFIRPEVEKRQALVRRINAALCGLFVLLALAGHALVAPKRAAEIAALEQQIAAIAPQVEKARRLSRETMELLDEQRLTVAGRKALDPLHLLERLSTLLPDGAWVTTLEIMRATGEVRLSGFADDATALLPLIEAVSGLADARLRGTVIKDPRGRERFDIAARLKQETSP